jgi:hypothetical protein
MTVVLIDEDKIVVQSPKAKNLLNVSRDEFEKISEIWPAYKAGRMQRKEVCKMTFHSKYIISILHWLEEQ